MSRRGGEAGKLGNRYEGIWTVDAMLDVLSGDANAITVEPLDDPLGIEFELQRTDGTKQFHSVKRQTSDTTWSLAALCEARPSAGRSILKDLFRRLEEDSANRVVFVSTTGAKRLADLCEIARQANGDFGHFLKRLELSPLRKEFDSRLLRLTSGSKEQAFDFLRRFTVNNIDEPQLARRVDQKIGQLVAESDGLDVSPRAVRLHLADSIIDRLGNEIDSTEIREILQPAYICRDWSKERTVVDRVQKVNDTYGRHVQAELINGQNFPRQESQAAVDLLLSEKGPRLVLIVAPSGYGKSCAVSQIAALLRSERVPFICLRLDAYPDADSPNDWGLKLELPAAPHVVLQSIAHARRSVLVVDQLDAMSIVSGRNPRLWDIFEQLADEVSRFPQMRLLAVCRRYDLEHDQRLRRLAKTAGDDGQIAIGPFDTSQVKSILKDNDIDIARLTADEFELLRIPVNLSLFLETYSHDQPNFRNVSDLYHRYWELKRQRVRERLGRPPNWNEVIDRLNVYLNDNQILSAPETVLDDWQHDAAAMVSEHVLVEENRAYRYFHESFFDYAFARRLVDTGRDFLEVLLGSEQHLFRRAQVRQVLTYARETNRPHYLQLLEKLLCHNAVRFHIKKVAVSTLSLWPDPSPEEWKLLDQIAADAKLGPHAFHAIRDQLPWFDLLNRNGIWSRLLQADDDSVVDRAIWLLTGPNVLKNRSRELEQVLRPFREAGDKWKDRLRYVMSWGHISNSDEMLKLFTDLSADGTLDERHPQIGRDWWMMLLHTSQERPEQIPALIGCWMQRRLALRRESGCEDPFDTNDQQGEMLITNSASALPRQFAYEVFPHVVSAIEATRLPESNGGIRDTIWRYRAFGYQHSISSAILSGLKAALECVAKSDPESFDALCNGYEGRAFETLDFLLISGWTANPSRYADRCLDFILRRANRLNIGYEAYSDGNGRAAVSRRAVGAATPHCSDALLSRLEDAIIGYTTPLEARIPQDRGLTEYLLLLSIAEERRSERVKLRLDELKGLFAQVNTALPTKNAFAFTTVGSPIAHDKAVMMSDEEWLSAMRKYSSNERWALAEELKGGAWELSRVLESETRKDRSRFAHLALRMPDTLNPWYFSAIFDGLCGTVSDTSPAVQLADKSAREALPTRVFADVALRLHNLPERPCGRSLSWGVQKLGDRDWPDELLELVAWYAVHDPDPTNEMWKVDAGGGRPYYGGDPEAFGINTVRGAAAEAISNLLFDMPDRMTRFASAIESLCSDPSVAVRTCAIGTLLPLLNINRDLGVSLFVRLVDGAPEVRRTHHFETFMYRATHSHYEVLREILLEAMKSTDDEAAQVAARQICLASFTNAGALTDVEYVVTGSPPLRRAASAIYETNLGFESLFEECESRLLKLFGDSDDEVREISSRCFHHMGGEMLTKNEDFLRAFIESAAFDHPESFFHALEQSHARLPDIVCEAAERFIRSIGAEGGNIASRAAHSADTVSVLVVRLYGQSSDAPTRRRCLDLIDEMEAFAYYRLQKELESIERQH
jgi:hypothetical protein